MTIVVSVLVTLVLGALAFAIKEWIGARARHIVAQEIVEKEMAKIIARTEDAKASLPDPDRPIDPKEIQDALKRIRDLGRKPL
jgi:hypothetical protein